MLQESLDNFRFHLFFYRKRNATKNRIRAPAEGCGWEPGLGEAPRMCLGIKAQSMLRLPAILCPPMSLMAMMGFGADAVQ